jgi:lipopolysaccharide export system permease protein
MTRLDRYIESATLKALVLVSTGLTLLFSLLELLDQLHDVGKGQYRLIDAVAYVLLTAPARLLQLMPVSVLLATLFALGTLAGHNELTVIRATGVSPRRIVGWVFKLAGPLMIALLLAAEFVIPPAQQLAQAQRLSRLSAALVPFRSGNSFWAAGDRRFVNVRRLEHGNVPRDIDIYAFADDGTLQTFIHADGAEIRPDGTWLLSGVLRKRFDGARVETDRVASLSWSSFLRPRQVPLLILPPESMPPIELYGYVRALERAHQPAARYDQELWAKLDIPLAMAAMILIAVPFVLGPLRTHGTGHRIAVGAMIGIVFTLVQQITSYLGQLLNMSPALPATLPSLMLMALALYLLRGALA